LFWIPSSLEDKNLGEQPEARGSTPGNDNAGRGDGGGEGGERDCRASLAMTTRRGARFFANEPENLKGTIKTGSVFHDIILSI